MKVAIVILFMLSSLSMVNAQSKQDYIWITGYDFAEDDGIQVNTANFNTGPTEFKLTEKLMSFQSNNASICDEDGNLLLYFNGCMLANGNNELVENGDSINAGDFQDLFWSNCKKFGYPGPQDVMILPDHSTDDAFYVLHKEIAYIPNSDNLFELQYAYVDLKENDGRGRVLEKILGIQVKTLYLAVTFLL